MKTEATSDLMWWVDYIIKTYNNMRLAMLLCLLVALWFVQTQASPALLAELHGVGDGWSL